MGAIDYSHYSVVKGDMRDAYHHARQEANYENGHQQGYSGDIQTSSSYMDCTKEAPRYGTKAFNKWENLMLDETLQKWDVCAGVEIKGKAAKLIKEYHGYKGKRGYRVFYFFGIGAE